MSSIDLDDTDFPEYLTSKAMKQPPKKQEPVTLPCCGYTEASAIKWNPFNGVVQCHNCGQTYALRQSIEQAQQIPPSAYSNTHQQEPVAWIAHANVQLGTPDGKPPQRQWVGLTDEEIFEIADSTQFGISPHDDTLRFAMAISAKLKEKNS